MARRDCRVGRGCSFAQPQRVCVCVIYEVTMVANFYEWLGKEAT